MPYSFIEITLFDFLYELFQYLIFVAKNSLKFKQLL